MLMVSSDPYGSDNEYVVEQNIESGKRQKLSEGERLTRCRERNRVHAKSTRDRKKSQLDCLESRIEELVDEKKRLNSSASESIVATILMSLSGIEKPAIVESAACLDDSGDSFSMPSYKVDGRESFEKKETEISSFDKDNKDTTELDVLLSKDKSNCSSLELDVRRREKNRVHAKKTRLRKKKMTQEMEGIISTLEREVGNLQDGLISLLPLPKESHDHVQSFPGMQTTQLKTAGELALLFQNHESFTDPSATRVKNKIPQEEGVNLGPLQATRLSRNNIANTLTNFSNSRKRKATSPSEGHALSTPLYEEPASSEAGNIIEAQENQYLWRQHLLKNVTKMVSLCSTTGSESTRSEGSEGSDSGSAINSLLNMGRNSPNSRTSGSGSDDGSETAGDRTTSKPPVVSNQGSVRPNTQHIRNAKIKTETHPTQFYRTYTAPLGRPETIQEILASCARYSKQPSNQPNTNWRTGDRPTSSFHSFAASTASAVASLYPTIHIADGNTGPYKGFLPMTLNDGEERMAALSSKSGTRSQDFTVYDGYKNEASMEGAPEIETLEPKGFPQRCLMESNAVSSICNAMGLSLKGILELRPVAL